MILRTPTDNVKYRKPFLRLVMPAQAGIQRKGYTGLRRYDGTESRIDAQSSLHVYFLRRSRKPRD